MGRFAIMAAVCLVLAVADDLVKPDQVCEEEDCDPTPSQGNSILQARKKNGMLGLMNDLTEDDEGTEVPKERRNAKSTKSRGKKAKGGRKGK
mmetsp:Transcript_2307/g.5159  ORF Transcript_2307/g.5159 Transcript_2307/m.5159 type:complete len:92 (-) Transcript_2307:186-461(-)